MTIHGILTLGDICENFRCFSEGMRVLTADLIKS